MPRLPRFFISADQVTPASITISGEDVHHIAIVLRMKPGALLVLSDGKGTDYTARITSVDRHEVKTEIVSSVRREASRPRVTLAQGLPKSDKMDFIMQKATELGVSSIAPVVTERTIVKVRDQEKRVARWQKICREAAMQSNRPDIPHVHQIRKLSDFLAGLSSLPAGALLLLPWEEATEPVKQILKRTLQAESVITLIGPEGGFSLQEAERTRAAGFHPVSLGPNILRTETAALAVLSMINYEFLCQ